MAKKGASRFEQLRRRAEMALQQVDLARMDATVRDVRDLLHELQVHQVELEMQNQELLEVRGELETSRDRYMRLYDYAPVGYFTIDRNGMVRSANLTLAALLDKDRTAMVGKPFSGMIARGSQDDYFRLLAARAPGQESVQILRANGDDLWAILRIEPLKSPGGELNEFWCSVIDITKRRQAEREVRHAKEELERRVEQRTAELRQSVDALQGEVEARTLAEQVLRKRGEQLSALATELTLAEQRERHRLARLLHDGLQQILVAARLHLEGLDNVTDAKVSERAREVHQLIGEAISVSRSLTADLAPPVLHEAGLLAGLGWLSRRMVESHGLAVSVSASGRARNLSEPLNVLLFQAARELLLNVVKHSGVREARVELVWKEDGLTVAISDEGKGFDPAKSDGEESGTSQFGLFGLQERLNTLNCRVKIASDPGKGCRVGIFVPLQRDLEGAGLPEPQLAPPVSAAATAANGAREIAEDAIRVVIVDDHAIVRQGLRTILDLQPDIAVVGEAADGQAGIRLVREARPAVVLMDISMPVMDGIQATREIRKEAPAVQVIGLSMFEEADRADAMRQAGAVNYLTKSGPADALISAIRSAAGVRADPAGGAAPQA